MVWDRVKFNDLIGGDADLAKQLIHLFLAEYPRVLCDLEEAIFGKDFARAEHLAHKLKGSLRTFYAHEAAGLAGHIESKAHVKNMEGAGENLNELKSLVATLIDDFATFPVAGR